MRPPLTMINGERKRWFIVQSPNSYISPPISVKNDMNWHILSIHCLITQCYYHTITKITVMWMSLKNKKSHSTWRGRQWCPRKNSKSIFGLVWPWPLTFDLWPPDSQSWPFHALAPWKICANWHQNRFIYLKKIVFIS